MPTAGQPQWNRALRVTVQYADLIEAYVQTEEPGQRTVWNIQNRTTGRKLYRGKVNGLISSWRTLRQTNAGRTASATAAGGLTSPRPELSETVPVRESDGGRCDVRQAPSAGAADVAETGDEGCRTRLVQLWGHSRHKAHLTGGSAPARSRSASGTRTSCRRTDAEPARHHHRHPTRLADGTAAADQGSPLQRSPVVD